MFERLKMKKKYNKKKSIWLTMKHLTLIVTFYSSKLKVIKRIEKKKL